MASRKRKEAASRERKEVEPDNDLFESRQERQARLQREAPDVLVADGRRWERVRAPRPWKAQPGDVLVGRLLARATNVGAGAARTVSRRSRGPTGR